MVEVWYYCPECNWQGDEDTSLISPKGITCPDCGCCLCTDHEKEFEAAKILEEING